MTALPELATGQYSCHEPLDSFLQVVKKRTKMSYKSMSNLSTASACFICKWRRGLTLRHTTNFVVALMWSTIVWAGGEQTLEKVVVSGVATALGVSDAASVGTVTQKQLESRTVYRPGELLESVPGLIVSQHSGEGKANQFYLRGFNLDHGTDLRTTVDGMIVNQRSHAHGQGWTDVNFLIPELAKGLEYRKGPYYASEGDFASAGSVNLRYVDSLAQGVASFGVGQNGFRRVLLANSPVFAGGKLLYALEGLNNDGPFVNPDQFRKLNGVLRYSQGDDGNGFNITGMAYKAKWNSTDQITQRAIDSGLIQNRFDTIDPTDGGASHRYSVSGAWRKSDETSSTQVSVFLIDNKLELFSNFTYFLDNPVHGDQFAQPDRRRTAGLNATYSQRMLGLGLESENTIGLQLQTDNIFNGLLNTKARQTISVTRQDHIVESNVGVFVENTTKWTSWFRSVTGLRADSYRFKVRGDNPDNSGTATATMINPKLSFVFGPWSKTELYLNAGGGFHSNDARGTTIKFDPKTGDAVDRVTPLVRSKGAELGMRGNWLPGLQTSLSVYGLDLGSELLFVGDAGTTEASRPSRRVGFELANYYKLSNWLTVDADVAFARARFRNSDPACDRIPGAVEGVASFALAVDNRGPWFGAAQLRYFGPRPLIEDNRVRSSRATVINARLGYRFTPKSRVELEGFNLANRKASAIDYYYTSRLPGELAAGVDSIHFHPIESRSFRLSYVMNF
jgi:TonB dependent receptor/TonB-dependent Receptor Plug Domain